MGLRLSQKERMPSVWPGFLRRGGNDVRDVRVSVILVAVGFGEVPRFDSVSPENSWSVVRFWRCVFGVAWDCVCGCLAGEQ